MRILVVDDRVPDPDFGAGFPRAYRLVLSLIELGHEIYFVPTCKDSLPSLNLDLLKSYNIEVWKDLEQNKDKTPDVAIMSRPHNVHYYMPKIQKLFPKTKLIYDTEALWFRRYDLQMSITGHLPHWAYRYDELGMAQKVDLCFVVNDEEKEILHSHNVKKVIKLAHALEVRMNGKTFEDRKDLLVVGGKLEDDSSNEDGLWWYLENCWEKTRCELDCGLSVTGVVGTKRLKENTFSNVNLMGHVDNLAVLYDSHKIFVASTRFATGIPWKVHEAMANGIPCIISRLLGDQLKLTDDSIAMIANTPEEFVEKAKILYNDRDKWNQMRENAFDYIQDECCIDKFKQILRATLEELLS